MQGIESLACIAEVKLTLTVVYCTENIRRIERW